MSLTKILLQLRVLLRAYMAQIKTFISILGKPYKNIESVIMIIPTPPQFLKKTVIALGFLFFCCFLVFWVIRYIMNKKAVRGKISNILKLAWNFKLAVITILVLGLPKAKQLGLEHEEKNLVRYEHDNRFFLWLSLHWLMNVWSLSKSLCLDI